MKAHRIRAAAGEHNTRSQKVIERLGFAKEGVARDAEYDEERDGSFFLTLVVEDENSSRRLFRLVLDIRY